MYSYIEGRDLKLNPLGYMTGSFLTLAEKSTSKLSLTVSLLSSSSPGVDWPSTLSSGILSLDLKHWHCHLKSDSFTSQYMSSTIIFQLGVMDESFCMSLCHTWWMKSYLRDLGFRLLCESDFESSENVVFRSKSERDFSLSDLSLVSTLLPLPRTWRGSSTLSSSTSWISSKVTGCVLPRPRRSVFFLTVLLWIRGQSSRSRLLFSKPCNVSQWRRQNLHDI